MHVAICDDNVADRKQMERLLQRESDKRMLESGSLYIDSYGNAESLLRNPRQYDVFFVDMCKGSITGIDVVDSLTSAGSTAPVVLCCSDINYRAKKLPSHVICLDKPIKRDELSEVLDRAQKLADLAAPLIELRAETRTHYVEEKDILYAIEFGRSLVVTLISGQEITLTISAENLFCQVEAYPTFLCPTYKSVINGRHISKFGFRKITMKDGKQFSLTGKCMEYAKYLKGYL